ncbi:MAG TPA: carboxymuconolactone decarboxylase family protein, partial [Verrucomicrobiae bacterium]
ITGFGLLAHLLRLARQGKITARIFADRLPAFDGALAELRDGVIPGAIERNREFLGDDLEVEPGVDESLLRLGCDSQTSGGLLIAVPPQRLARLLTELNDRAVPAFVVGDVVATSAGRVILTRSSAGAATSVSQADIRMENKSPLEPNHGPGCCADVFAAAGAKGTAAEAQKGFSAMMQAVQAAGALSDKTKELISFALVLQSRCTPCFEAHYEKARALGLTRAELDEAAWCAIAMGGAPVRMFYQECLRRAEDARCPE